MSDIELTHEEKMLNEYIYVILDENPSLTAQQLAQTLNQPLENIRKALLLIAKEEEVECVKENDQESWRLTDCGKTTAYLLQRAYLEKVENYKPKKLTPTNLTPELIQLLEYFENTDEEHPKRLSNEFIQTHTSKENYLCIEFPSLSDLLESGYLSHADHIGFKYFYANAHTEHFFSDYGDILSHGINLLRTKKKFLRY
jgi:hypothetical protein